MVQVSYATIHYPIAESVDLVGKRSAVLILKQLQNSSFKGFAFDNELTFSIYNYKKEPKDRLYFHQLDKKDSTYNIHVDLTWRFYVSWRSFNFIK